MPEQGRNDGEACRYPSGEGVGYTLKGSKKAPAEPAALSQGDSCSIPSLALLAW
jgi:hypothetical protein